MSVLPGEGLHCLVCYILHGSIKVWWVYCILFTQFREEKCLC